MGLLWIYASLALAIAAEVVATLALARSESFTRPGPTVLSVLGYLVAIYLLSIAIRVLPTGIVYAIWSGMGIVLISAASWLWYDERLDAPAILGLVLILAGVVVVNVFSDSLRH